jgi:hypothetical protein
MLTLEFLKEWLYCDEETSIFTRIKACPGIKVGTVAGRLKSNGYAYISVGGRSYRAHRLVWFYNFGEWPKSELDHINGIKNDNRLCNLREVTRSQNMQNCGKYLNNTSGFKGVSWNKQSNKWKAQICISGKHKHLGSFDTPEEASIAYQLAAKELHGEFLHN